jgi:CubicO group peptidase (beta-lactamase class C family)
MPNSWHAGAQLYAATGDYNRGGDNGTLFRVDPREELVVIYMAHAPGEPRLYYRALMKSLVMQALVK